VDEIGFDQLLLEFHPDATDSDMNDVKRLLEIAFQGADVDV
jgi:hypothetical protein